MTGSTRAPRQAGTAAATNAASSSVPTGNARLETSSAATSNSIVSTKRDAYSAPARPQAAPISVGAVSRLPVTGTFHSWGAQRTDRPADSRFTGAQQRVVEGRYFDAVGIPLLRGRVFGGEDDAKAPPRVVVSEELVRQLFPSEDPIGKRLRVAGAQREIIGVVGD